MRKEEAERQEQAREAKLAQRAKNAISVKQIRLQKQQQTGSASQANSHSPMNQDLASGEGAEASAVASMEMKSDAREQKQLIVRSNYISKLNENKRVVSENQERL